jgi:hypothetical protein
MKSFIILTILFVSALSADKNCWKNTMTRGVGKPIHACATGLVNQASLCYTPCRAGFNGIGPICWKGIKNYGRGVGKVLQCGPNEENSSSLCYPPCQANSNGIGPVCWGLCPKSMTECGAMCTPDAAACAEVNKEMIKKVFNLVGSAASAAAGSVDVSKIVKNSKEVVTGFVIPVCPAVRLPPHRGSNIFQKISLHTRRKVTHPHKGRPTFLRVHNFLSFKHSYSPRGAKTILLGPSYQEKTSPLKALRSSNY